MSNADFKIEKITVAVTHMTQMHAFYTAVFKCELKAIQNYGTTLYAGAIGDIDILLCPNEIAGVKAEQNRQQFDFIVTNLDLVIRDAKTSGGKLQEDVHVSEKQKTVTIIDPDGNTIVFIQKRM